MWLGVFIGCVSATEICRTIYAAGYHWYITMQYTARYLQNDISSTISTVSTVWHMQHDIWSTISTAPYEAVYSTISTARYEAVYSTITTARYKQLDNHGIYSLTTAARYLQHFIHTTVPHGLHHDIHITLYAWTLFTSSSPLHSPLSSISSTVLHTTCTTTLY